MLTSATILALVFCVTARSTLNAADPHRVEALRAGSLAQQLLRNAAALARTLHATPLEERATERYLSVMDAYGQVIRLNSDISLSAESLKRMAELQCELANSTGDSALYHQAISSYRRLVDEYPSSALVGEALISIARVYEENLQDLDGAAAAFADVVRYFPNSVLAREARAVLTRYERQLQTRPPDVLLGDYDAGGTDVINIRNFTASNYARVVVDLSGPVQYTARYAERRVELRLRGAAVSSSLRGRRFIVADNSFLKRVVAEQQGSSGLNVSIDLASPATYSSFSLTDPDRLVIDVHRADSRLARAGGPIGSPLRPGPRVFAGMPLLALPDVEDPGAHLRPGESRSFIDGFVAGLIESRARCIVIDPGHGGHDAGTIGSGGLHEKELVLDVAKRLRSMIKSRFPGIEVVLTRETDRYLSLEERTAIANGRQADLFISIHANAAESRIASGVETFFISPDRAREQRLASNGRNQTARTPIVASISAGNRVAESRELARYIQAGLVRGVASESPAAGVNRGVKHAPFTVLASAAMPSVLAEVSFVSNARDEALLRTPEFRQRLAASLFSGLSSYLRRGPRAKPAD